MMVDGTMQQQKRRGLLEQANFEHPTLREHIMTTLDFKDLLAKQGYDLSKVMVMRHRPTEAGLRLRLPWYAVEQPSVYNAYQCVQSPDAEKALTKAEYVASFIADEGSDALFVGMYRRSNWRTITEKEFWNIPEMAQLRPLGIKGIAPDRETALCFELDVMDDLADLKGRLVVIWPTGRLWWRWAASNNFTVRAIHEDSALDGKMPPWDQLSLSWEALGALPSKWRAVLAQWRGIYFIFDQSDGKGYVGSAYGTDNLLGRWLNYARSGHGENKLLKQRDPRGFLFTILQRVSPDMEKDDVIRLEKSWKDRLHTHDAGLNDN